MPDIWANYWYSHGRDDSRCQKQRTLWTHTPSGRQHHRVTHLGGQHLGRNAQQLLSQRECSSPIYLILQLRNGSGGFYSNNWGADPVPNRAVTTTEQRVISAQHPVQVLVTTPSTPPYQGDKGQHTMRKTWQASIPKTALEPKILDSHSLHRVTPT